MLCLLSCSAFAQQSSGGSFQVSTSVQGGCVLTAETLNFGEYNPDRMKYGYSNISVKCTAGSTNVSVFLDQGRNAESTSTCSQPQRRLISGDGRSYLKYDLKSESDPFGQWGCDTNGEFGSSNGRVIKSFTSSLEPVVIGTYAVMPSQQDVPIGSYSDTIGVNVVF